jgi:hypothetical protein
VRLAGASFSSPYDLRSPAFERLLRDRGELRRHIADAREALLTALFLAIPKTADRTARRQLLDAKRRVYNSANSAPVESAGLTVSADLAALFHHYQELQFREESLLDGAKTVVLGEIRQQIRRVWEGPKFRLACRYVSPDLAEDLEKNGFPDTGELTSVERGLYAFLSRWLSKANPFHLFAAVAFPPAAGIPMDGDHEIVLDATDLLAREQRLLDRVEDPRRLHIHLRPFQRLGRKLVFWVPGAEGFRLVSQEDGDLFLRVTIDFFAERRLRGAPTGTVADWQGYVAGRLGADRLSEAEESLKGWSLKGVMRKFLITDFDRFAPDLQGISAEIDESLARLQNLHLARLSTAELERAVEKKPEMRYYVNSYGRLETTEFEAAAEELGPSLQALKPFFSQEHNFDRQDHVIRSYFLDYLAHRSSERAPYLEILRHFLRHHREITSRYQPEHQPLEECSARLVGLTGHLSADELRALAPLPVGDLPNLCFNGPFDFVKRVFYITNIFAGEARFVARYLLHRRKEEQEPRIPASDGELHVELAVPPEPNLNYVVRRFSVGCGFDARYAYRFERWIDPSEILVERAEDGIAYRDSRSGLRLRLHYRGFQLAHQLPAEYQLLLAGHADAFHNPFRGPMATGENIHDPGLFCGPVCLRRENWTVGQDFWASLSGERDSLRFAAHLRDHVHGHLQPVDLWYYQGAEHKPRFLDLRNPLSALAFRHKAFSSAGAVLALSVMQPSPSHLYHHQGNPVVTELMIEV